MIFVPDFSLGDIETHLQHVFDAICLLVGVPRDSIPLIREVLFGSYVLEDEKGVEDKHNPYKNQGDDC